MHLTVKEQPYCSWVSPLSYGAVLPFDTMKEGQRCLRAGIPI